MAQRYSGQYSPDPSGDPANSPPEDNRFRGLKPHRANIWARLLFLAPVPLLLAGLGEIMRGNVLGTVVELGAFGILMLAAWLLHEGLRAEAAFDARKIARAPGLPRKMLAAILAGGGTALAAFSGFETGIIGALVFGAVAVTAHIFAFGLDPMRNKGMTGMDAFETERVAKAVDRAETTVTELLDAAKRINDRPLEARIEHLAATVRDVFRTVEDDPRDLTRARKFMTVYLKGARDATAKFADIYARRRDPSVRAEYEALLTDLETSFATHKEDLLLDDRTALDVEIEVLRERLQREGVLARQE